MVPRGVGHIIRSRSELAALLERTSIVEGLGLHTGAPARVVLAARASGGVTLALGGRSARVDELAVVSTDRATTVEAAREGVRVATVEHLFAALAGMGIYERLAISIEGPEMPLLDGGASAWCQALDALDLGASAGPPLRVTRRATLVLGASSYEFAPSDSVDVDVHIDFGDARLAREARWSGDVRDFRDRIAPARTFAFESDLGEFVRRGLARHVAPEAVVVVTPHAILSSGAAFSSDEPARHKLLDLVGDLYVHGGMVQGRIRAVRPGHTANARAFAWALAEGILQPRVDRLLPDARPARKGED
jgi:UDP-3-O-[3-hydroxymyristoyl] N-acetylglucosamine deacetylase